MLRGLFALTQRCVLSRSLTKTYQKFLPRQSVALPHRQDLYQSSKWSHLFINSTTTTTLATPTNTTTSTTNTTASTNSRATLTTTETTATTRTINQISMLAFIEVIGSGSCDCSSSVQLFFNDGRYLFECGDGTQRLCTEYGMKLSRLRGIYLSSVTAPSVGGLFGLLLTVADIGKEKMSIVAPKGICQLFHSARTFYYRPTFVNRLHEIDTNLKDIKHVPISITNDECVNIEAVPITARRDIEIDTAFGMHCDVVSYICRLKDLPGKFDPKKAISLGVQKGRLFGMLQKGNTVTLDNGTQVKSEQVMSPTTPGPIVLIIACPSVHHIDSLTTAGSLTPSKLGISDIKTNDENFENNACNGNNNAKRLHRTCVICHLGPRDVLSHPHYRKWCDSFGDKVSHIPLHASMSRRQTIFLSQAEDMALLHYSVDKDLFPLPKDCLFPNTPTTPEEARKITEEKSSLGVSQDTKIVSVPDKDDHWHTFNAWNGQWIGAESKLKFNLAPAANIGIDRSAVRSRFVERNVAHPLREWRNILPSYASEPAPAGTEMATPHYMKGFASRTAAVHFLGTGAAIPGKRRNVSATLLDLYARGSVLLDCGEGTWGQLVRLFGREEAQRAICSIRIVFISHMHADHHLGLMSLLHQRSIAMIEQPSLKHGPQLVIIGPCHLNTWLNGFQQAARVPLLDKLSVQQRAFRFFDAATLKDDPQTTDSKFFIDAFGLELGCVDVIHCPLSYGLVIRDCINSWKVVFSGDTRPCPALVRIGRDATLAIHEATLEDELSEEAHDKRHSTTSEALDVCANQMKAWRTILTHFSQRYPKIPRLDDSVLEKLYKSRAAVASDLMSVDFAQLEELPRVVPALRDCFPDECEQWVTTSGLKSTESMVEER